MSKATLIGIATQPRYDDDEGWLGVDIMANIEVDITEGAKIGTDCVQCMLYDGFGACVEHGYNLVEQCVDFKKGE